MGESIRKYKQIITPGKICMGCFKKSPLHIYSFFDQNSIDLLISTIENIINSNEIKTYNKKDVRADFESMEMPSFTIRDYINNFINSKNCELLLYSLLLCQILCIKIEMTLDANNIYRLFLTSFTIAYKLMYDCPKINLNMSEMGGVDMQDLQIMESIFLNELEWNINISSHTFYIYAMNINQIYNSSKLALKMSSEYKNKQYYIISEHTTRYSVRCVNNIIKPHFKLCWIGVPYFIRLT